MSGHVFITGAGTGIGHAAAEGLLERGFRIVGTAVNDAEAARLRSEWSRFDGRFSIQVLDVRDEAAVEAAAAEVAQLLGDERPQAVINVAGVIVNGPLLDLDAASFSNVLAVNVVGMHNVTRALLPHIARGGRIVNVSSQSGRRVAPFTGAYGASKHAVEALSTAMRMEFAPLGIRVSVIAPGQVRTPMAEAILEHLSRQPTSDLYAEPMRRFTKVTREMFDAGLPIERVAQALIHAATDAKPELRYDLPANVVRDKFLMRMIPVRPREAIVRRALALQDKGQTLIG